MLTGLIYQNKERKSYEESVTVGFKEEALAKQDLKLSREEFDKLVTEFK